jgi:hypothetical protein
MGRLGLGVKSSSQWDQSHWELLSSSPSRGMAGYRARPCTALMICGTVASTVARAVSVPTAAAGPSRNTTTPADRGIWRPAGQELLGRYLPRPVADPVRTTANSITLEALDGRYTDSTARTWKWWSVPKRWRKNHRPTGDDDPALVAARAGQITY